MKFSSIGWLVVGAICVAALLHQRSSPSNACAVTASLLAPANPTRSDILKYPLIDAATDRPVTLADFKGKAKAIYIDVFASWCGACQGLIPHVKDLHKKLRDKGVIVLGLNVSDKWEAMQRNIQSKGIDYPVLFDNGNGGGIHSMLEVKTIPTVIILDGATLEQKGRWIGGDNDAERDAVLASLGVK